MAEGHTTITLTTDFGLRDPWVGSMKGVGLFLAPQANIVDISHEVEAGNIFEGAFILANTYGSFPKGTIHVAVVDPGVGSDRDPIVILTDNYFLVGPDNGILSLAVQNANVKRIIKVTNDDFFQKPISSTFHGRDIFMPVAGYITRGVGLHDIGEDINDFVKIDYPHLKKDKDSVEGEVIYVDHFGNLITNITSESVQHLIDAGKAEIEINSIKVSGVDDSYSDKGEGATVALIGSLGFLEIASYKDRAVDKASAKIGDKVTVRG